MQCLVSRLTLCPHVTLLSNFLRLLNPQVKYRLLDGYGLEKKMDTIETELEKAKHIINRAVFYNGKTTESYATKLRV